MKGVKAWFLLFRPWSYTATAVPFLGAAALAYGATGVSWMRWTVGFAAGLLFQATVNLLNTWGDERSGVDSVPGAIRTTPQVHDGLVSMRALGIVALACAFLAGALGLALVPYRAPAGGWRMDVPLLVAGFVGFLGATNYSTGFRFKYRGLGVPFVSLLMGPLEFFVAWVLACPPGCALSPAVLARTWVGSAWMLFFVVPFPIAALVGVIMHGNDMRDIPTDRLAGIRTFAILLGVRGSLAYYVGAHLVAYAVPFCLAVSDGFHPVFFLPFLAFPLSVATCRTAVAVYRSDPSSPPWRGLERGSGKLHFFFGALYALAFALAAALVR